VSAGKDGRVLARVFGAERIWVYAAAWVAVLFGSLLSLLNFHEYPIWRPEVGIIAAAMGAAALALGYVHVAGGRLRPLVDAALVYLAVDLNFDGSYAVGAAITAALVAIFVKRSIAPAVAVVFSVVVAGQLATALTAEAHAAAGTLASKSVESGLPAIVHVVLDEHIGVEGLAVTPELAATRAHMVDFYTGRGFTLYGGAHSRHFHTINSLPEILNFGKTEVGGESRANRASRIEHNAWFDALRSRGYQINVRQSDFIDYCGHKAVASCQTYRRSDLLPMASSSLTAPERARIIASAFVSLSSGLMRASNLYDFTAVRAAQRGVRLPILNIDMVRLGSTLAALDSANAFVNDLRGAKPGQAYFVHLLFPHYPHATRPDCSIKPLEAWRYRRIGGDMTSRNAAYADQLLCSTRIVDSMLKSVASSPAAKNAVFIVHGDHGSRITVDDPKITNIDQVAGRDLVVGYSTLFAVRVDAGEGSYDPRMAAVSSLLRQFSGSGLRSVPVIDDSAANAAEVYIEDGAWRPMFLRPLPAFRAASDLRKN